MTISFNPHSFVVFLTLAMGMGYAVASSRSGWGFLKIFMVAVFVLPFLYYGFTIGHPVEISLGLFLGWMQTRGGISLPSFHPFQGIVNFFSRRKAERAYRKQQKQEERNARRDERKRSTSSYDDVANRRAEQARAQRKQTKAKAGNSQKSKSHDDASGKQEQARHQEYKPPVEPIKKRDTRTPYEILGVSPDASQAQIKKAYNILRSRFHPDKYSQMSEVFRNEAEEEFKKVKESYEKCVG